MEREKRPELRTLFCFYSAPISFLSFLFGFISDISADYSPHTLGAEDLYKAHLMPYLQEAQATLNDKLEANHTQNAELAQTVQTQRVEIEQLLSQLESVIGDLEGAATTATQFSKEHHLRQDAVQMDEEVNARPGL
jgi:kinetochore protein NNF1